MPSKKKKSSSKRSIKRTYTKRKTVSKRYIRKRNTPKKSPRKRTPVKRKYTISRTKRKYVKRKTPQRSKYSRNTSRSVRIVAPSYRAASYYVPNYIPVAPTAPVTVMPLHRAPVMAPVAQFPVSPPNVAAVSYGNLFGITNTGIMCYFNAMWQLLHHILFAESKYATLYNTIQTASISNCQRYLLTLLAEPFAVIRKTNWTPNETTRKNFVKCFVEDVQNQQDTEELLRYVVKQLNSLPSTKPIIDLFSFEETTLQRCVSDGFTITRKVREQNCVRSALYGNSIQEIIDYYQNYKNNANIRTDSHACTLWQEKFETKITGKYFFLQIFRVTDQLQYFSKSLDLNNDKLTFNDGTNLRLIGGIVHTGYTSGSMDCGHYIAYRKINSLWYQFNDLSVSIVPNSSALKNAYILLYEVM